MATLTYTDTLQVLECGNCRISFAMPVAMYRRARETGDWFWCPKGCRIHYFESENDRLRKEAERAEAKAARAIATADRERARAEHLERQRRAAKGQLTRTKNRIAKGVCPCCNRSFVDLGRHMETKHPDYAGAATD